MLPWPHGGGVTQLQWGADLNGTHQIWDESVGCPVATADHIASTSGSHLTTLRAKKGLTIGKGDQFRAGLAAPVGVHAAKPILFRKRPCCWLRRIAFVCGDIDRRPRTWRDTHGFQNVYRAHDIDGEGRGRILVGDADNRLCGQMKNNFRPGLQHRTSERGAVPNVSIGRAHAVCHSRGLEEAGFW